MFSALGHARYDIIVPRGHSPFGADEYMYSLRATTSASNLSVFFSFLRTLLMVLVSNIELLLTSAHIAAEYVIPSIYEEHFSRSSGSA